MDNTLHAHYLDTFGLTDWQLRTDKSRVVIISSSHTSSGVKHLQTAIENTLQQLSYQYQWCDIEQTLSQPSSIDRTIFLGEQTKVSYMQQLALKQLPNQHYEFADLSIIYENPQLKAQLWRAIVQ